MNVIVDARRRSIRWRTVLGRLDRTSERPDAVPSDLADLDHLKPVDRAVLYLTEVERMPQAEAARLLGLSHDAVRLRASRSRRQLRLAIEQEETP